MEVGEPVALARLPRSPSANGKTFFTPVYGLINGVKRRRQELCVAVDGHSVNVYDASSGRNLSSYPIPPDSVLSCAPCSLRSKLSESNKFRSTYYVTSRRGETVLAVSEEEGSGSSGRPLSKSIVLESGKSPVVQLEILPISDSYHVLVVSEDGTFEVYERGLSSRIRQGKLLVPNLSARFVGTQWLSQAQAQESVLKARPDVTALTDPTSSFIVGVLDASESLEKDESWNFQLAIWELSSLDSKNSTFATLEPALCHHLPMSTSQSIREKVSVYFTNKDTRLILKSQAKSQAFDLTQTTPHLTQETSPLASDHLSSIFINDALALCSTSTTVQLHNTRFKTLQTKLDLEKIGSKRKRSSLSGGPIMLLAYFPLLRRVLATRRDQLVAIDLQMKHSKSFSSATRQASLLVNNIGRSTAPYERPKVQDWTIRSVVGKGVKQKESSEKWQEINKLLDKYVQERDYVKFESAFLEHISRTTNAKAKGPAMLEDHKFEVVMSKIFEYDATMTGVSSIPHHNFRLAIPAYQVLELLIVQGYLTVERISKVLRAHNQSHSESALTGSVSELIVQADSSLNLLFKYLLKAPFIPYRELCVAIQILLRQALALSNASPSLAILGIAGHSLLPDAAVLEPQALEKGKDVISTNAAQCLYTSLHRLADVAHGNLSNHLRQHFSQEEIVALVQILRQQLFRSGYTRSLQTQSELGLSLPDSTSSALEPLSASVKVEMTLPTIVSTLSSCIDALGPMGMLSFGEEEAFIKGLIPELSSEIARATEAVQEATFLQGILRETLRFAESATQAESHGGFRDKNPDIGRMKTGTITTLYSESITEGNVDGNSAMLPLSLRAEGKINTNKVRKGDGKVSRRSGREMGMHQDRLRGPYSLERLTL